jgi:hypothetical protein
MWLKKPFEIDPNQFRHLSANSQRRVEGNQYQEHIDTL